MIKNILFDLDGTLTDPMKSFRACLDYAFGKIGAIVPDDNEIKKWVGPPLGDTLKDHLNLSREDAEKVLVFYREYYRTNGISGNEIYPEIKPMLKALKDKGLRLGIASAKLEEFVLEILKMHDILHYFDVVSGATFDRTRTQKGDIIAHAIKLMGADKESIVMVGDRKYDVLGAKEQNLRCIGVTWGYGTRKELQLFGADFVVDTPSQLVQVICNELSD